jgi:hypothetical protein
MAYVPRRRYWRDAMDDGLFDNLYFAPPAQQQQFNAAPLPQPIVLNGLMAAILIILVLLLVASLRR